jgi:Zn finger protein HypA/HybF involved in hydrogenase expression
MVNLMRKINAIGEEKQSKILSCVKVRLGALSYIFSHHLREHFAQPAKESRAEKAQLDIEVLTNLNGP